jgi:hypothetical protein
MCGRRLNSHLLVTCSHRVVCTKHYHVLQGKRAVEMRTATKGKAGGRVGGGGEGRGKVCWVVGRGVDI